jgi:hypothetical protein
MTKPKRKSKPAKPRTPRAPKAIYGVLWYSVGFKRWKFDNCESRQEAEEQAAHEMYWPVNRPRVVKVQVIS